MQLALSLRKRSCGQQGDITDFETPSDAQISQVTRNAHCEATRTVLELLRALHFSLLHSLKIQPVGKSASEDAHTLFLLSYCILKAIRIQCLNPFSPLDMTKTQPQKAVSSTVKRIPRSIREEQTNEISISRIFIVVLGVSALLVGLYIQLTKNLGENLGLRNDGSDVSKFGNTLVVADNMDAGYLDHVIDALLNFGHKLSFSGSITPLKATDLDRYKLIWTHDYPFQTIKKLDPLQRVNHFPGTGFITNKITLSTTPRVPHILKAFRLPHEKERFLDHSKRHPNQLWIQKSDSHRGISIKTSETVDFDLGETLVQEYMANPLLIDGKKFDIGIYAVLTSVEPLRVYTYEAESLLRFCAHPYLDKETQQFNSSDIDSYVVGDDYTPIWLMPSLLRHYIGANLSMKQSLNTYLKGLNKDGTRIWSQIEETIKRVYKMKEQHIARMARIYQEQSQYNDSSVEGSLNQFFEMVRFDFIVDEHLNVFLMEANMSPNLSSRHFPPNRLLYEQVLSSYFSLVGLGQYALQHLSDLPVSYLDGRYQMARNSIKPSSGGVNQRYGLDSLISDKDLAVYEELCTSNECHMNCHKVDCRVCFFCLNYSDKLHLRRAIFEHHSRWNFKRLLPSTRDEDLELQLVHPDTRQEAIDSNYIHTQWFRGKCHSDQRFCSY